MGARLPILIVCLTLGCEETRLGDNGDLDAGTRLCVLSSDIIEDTVLGVTDCRAYVVEAPMVIREGATLTVAPGTELRFERGAGFTIGEGSDGRLEIHGTPDNRVVLTSLAPDDDEGGRWSGILFRGSTLPGSVIKHAVISNAVGEKGGCVMLESTAPGAVTLEGIRIERCSRAAIWVDVQKVELIPPLEVADSEFGISLAARNVADLPLPLLLENVRANEIRGGAITESATWIAQSVPWVITGNIDVESPEIPVLTLEAGVDLRFRESTWLEVGGDAPGALVVEGNAEAPVLFDADNPGGWHGIVIGREADLRTKIDFAHVRGGGRRGSNVRGCLTIDGNAPIAITNSRFEACEQAGIGAIDPFFRFGRLENNAFADTTVGLWLNARSVGSITSPQQFESVVANLMEGDELGKNAVWIGQPIPWLVSGSITVQSAEDPILRLETGVHLLFPPSSWLQIGDAESGGLVAIGTDSDPVIIESAEPMAGPGAWRGIVFGANAGGGSRIERAIVRHGGQEELDAKGCLTVRAGEPRPIAILRSTFEQCAQAAIAAVDGTFAFETLSDNVIRDSEAGLHLSASSVAALGSDPIYEKVPYNRITGDAITADALWTPRALPWVVEGTIAVEGPNAPVLGLDAGLELLFEAGASIHVGTSEPGGLSIVGTAQIPVSLSSTSDVPMPGDWGGIVLGPLTAMNTSIQYARIEYAGEPLPGVLGAITLFGTEARVRIAATEFLDNAQADIWVDCMSQPLLTGNVYSFLGPVFETGCN